MGRRDGVGRRRSTGSSDGGVKGPASGADDNDVSDQSEARCPRCAAHVRADAPWCTLCYADLRPPPPPPPPRRPAVGRHAAAPATVDPLTAPLELIEGGGAVQTAFDEYADADTDTDTDTDADAAPTGWPCPRCEAVVSFDESTCSTCGTGFLAGVSSGPDVAARLGGRDMSKGLQVMIIGGGSVAVIAVIVGLLFVVGLFV